MDWINSVILSLSASIEHFIAVTGYVGVVLLMAIESFNIPLPSEIILTFTGYLVQQGTLNFHLAALAGAIGCVVGSIPSYLIGYKGGRPFLEKHGKWLLLTHHDLDASERWVQRYGDFAFFLCRMLPVIRTFISLPAGILRARFGHFVLYTFLGSWIWSYGLVWVGFKFGENKAAFSHVWHQFDALIVGTCLVLGAVYVYKHVQHFKAASQKPSAYSSETINPVSHPQES